MPKRVLVVDDDPDTVRGLEDCLTEWGIDVETARDGAEALQLLGREALTGMTLGINMPRMNGVEVLRHLRGTDQSMPVLIISAGYDFLNEGDLHFLRDNAQALLPKPWDRDQLKMVVKSWFGLPHDKALRDLAVSHAQMGRIEAARQTASQITAGHFQRSAWMGILYAQFFTSLDLTGVKDSLEDLRAVKATLASLADDSLWYGSWVSELLRVLVNAGDNSGAIEIVSRLKDPFKRGLHYADIAGTLALNNDPEGVDGILGLVSDDPDRVLSQDLDMLDMALGTVARQHAWVGGDIERARQYAARISGETERKWIFGQIEHPPL
jgi:CheY-like chemotaxis protein